MGDPENVRLLIAGTAVLVLALVVDLGPGVALTGYFGLGPLILAAACPPLITAGIGGLTVAMAIISGIWDHRFGTQAHIAAIILVLVQSAIAVYICVYRERQRSKLHRVQAVAEVAQRALLPAVPGQLDGTGFAARYLSAAQEASVGGDLYEVVSTSNGIRVIIGDVRGKGLPAVRLASVVLGAFREAAVTWLDPEQVTAACARAVGREAGPEDFVTALVLDIHPDGRLGMCSAGHHPPRLVSADRSSTLELRSPSPPLGLAERFTVTTAQWEVGDRLAAVHRRPDRGQGQPGTLLPPGRSPGAGAGQRPGGGSRPTHLRPQHPCRRRPARRPRGPVGRTATRPDRRADRAGRRRLTGPHRGAASALGPSAAAAFPPRPGRSTLDRPPRRLRDQTRQEIRPSFSVTEDIPRSLTLT